MKANIGLTDDQLIGIKSLLERLLADQYVLYTKTRNFHWNVQGPEFYELHKLFEEQYDQLDEQIDEVAERIRQRGFLVNGSLAAFGAATRLSEVDDAPKSAQEMIAILLKDYETLITHLKEAIPTAQDQWNDAGTADLFTGYIQDYEKTAWFLRSLNS